MTRYAIVLFRSLCAGFIILFPATSMGIYADEKIYYTDEIVVTASRVTWPIDKTASFTRVISKEEIRKYQTDSVVEVLRSAAGMDIVQSGSMGKTSSIFIRGANSNHCLVMLDGVPINDPTTGAFDFSDLTTVNIERIEIVRGPHGILYGSTAIGGVINIISTRAAEGARRSICLSGGSFGTATGSVDLTGGGKTSNYALSILRTTTDGRFSNDFYKNTSLSGSVRSHVTPTSNISVNLKYSDVAKGLRGSEFDTDPNAVQSGGSFFISAQYQQFVHRIWNYYIRTSFYTNEITFDDPVDPLEEGPFAGDAFSEINSDIQNVTWQNNLRFLENLWFTAGLEWREERTTNSGFSPFGTTSFDNEINNIAYFFNGIVDPKSLPVLALGARVDDHSEFGTISTYKLSISYSIDRTRTTLKGSIGSGFRAPSLNELYYPGYGNPDLSPEKAQGYDVGFSQEIDPLQLSCEVSYFRNDYENMIAFNLETYTADNIGKSFSDGMEISLKLEPWSFCTVSGHYTYLRTEDCSTKKQLLRRPRHSGGFSINLHGDPLDVLLSASLVGKRLDNDFGGPLGEYFNPSYTRYDLAVTYRYSRWYELFVRVCNVLDEHYTEVAGYPSPDLHTIAGARITF
ncbi:MAG: TonB-dependent receptor [bacterium]|nr:MAG: TonB-dependent receptor [bacterium]